MNKQEYLKWEDFKKTIDDTGYDFKSRTVGNTLILEIHEKKFKAWTRIHTDGDMSDELIEYQETYQEKANQFLFDIEGDGVPVLPPTFKVELSDTIVDLPKATEDFRTFYIQNGAGRFFGFEAKFNSDNVQARLEIDGNEIFNINCAILEDLTPNTSSGGALETAVNYLTWNDQRNCLVFCAPAPIAYRSNIKIEARANNGSSNRELQIHKVHLTKETVI